MKVACASLSRLQQGSTRQPHTAIVENKRLRPARTVIKAQQDMKCQPKIQTNSEKGGYRKTLRKVYGLPEEQRNSPPPAETVEMTVPMPVAVCAAHSLTPAAAALPT
jgi:hypothetical protein